MYGRGKRRFFGRRRGRGRFGRKRFGKFSRKRNFQVRRYSRRITTSREKQKQVSDRQMVKLSKTFNTTITIANGNTFGGSIPNPIYGNMLKNPGVTPPIDPLPAGTDQWASFYASCRILGSRIKVIPYQTTGLLYTLSITPTVLTASTQPAITQDGIYDNPFSKYRIVSQNPDFQVITNYMSSKKMFGQPVTYEDDYQMVFGYSSTPPYPFQGIANYPPTDNRWVWNLYAETPTAVMQDTVIPVKVTVDYYCRFEDKVNTNAFIPSI